MKYEALGSRQRRSTGFAYQLELMFQITRAHREACRRGPCIAAQEKIAVDPAFRLSARTRRRAAAKAHATHYFENPSDIFFATETAFLEERGIDVALIDGLHTYRQVIRDVENTLRYLTERKSLVEHCLDR